MNTIRMMGEWCGRAGWTARTGAGSPRRDLSDRAFRGRSRMRGMLVALAVAFLGEAAVPAARAEINNGDGIMTVTPVTVVSNSTGNSFTFSFRNNTDQDMSAGGQVSLLVPAGWTAPQNSNAANPGYVSLNPVGTGAETITSITGTGPWTILVTVTVKIPKNTNSGFDLTYAGGGSKVTAPGGTGLHTFTTMTKKSGGTLTLIASSPTVRVTGVPVKLAITSVNGGNYPTEGSPFSPTFPVRHTF